MTSKNEPSGWAIGWTAFAPFMMIMMGIWWILSGLAVVYSELYVVTFRWIFEFDISTWGWVHLMVGIVVLLAGIFLFRGAVWARTVAVQGAVLPEPPEGPRRDG